MPYVCFCHVYFIVDFPSLPACRHNRRLGEIQESQTFFSKLIHVLSFFYAFIPVDNVNRIKSKIPYGGHKSKQKKKDFFWAICTEQMNNCTCRFIA